MIGSIVFAIVKEKGLCLFSILHSVSRILYLMNCLMTNYESDETSKRFENNESCRNEQI